MSLQAAGVPAWQIELKTPLAAGKTQKVEIDMTVVNSLELYPKQITQKEKQLVCDCNL